MFKTSAVQTRLWVGVLLCSWGSFIAVADLPGPAGSIVGWGVSHHTTNKVLSTIPAGDDFVDLAAGAEHAVALRKDGSLVGWGRNLEGQIDVPSGNDFIDVHAGVEWSAALRSNGTVTIWGQPPAHPEPPAFDDYVSLSGSTIIGFARRSNGEIWGWGATFGGLQPYFDTDILKVAGYYSAEIALHADGTLSSRAFSPNSRLIANMPTGDDFVEMGGGWGAVITKRATGMVEWWGYHNGSVYEPTATLIDWDHSGGVILRADGTLLSLGGLSTAPNGHFVYADVGGSSEHADFGLAITPEPGALTLCVVIAVGLLRRRN